MLKVTPHKSKSVKGKLRGNRKFKHVYRDFVEYGRKVDPSILKSAIQNLNEKYFNQVCSINNKDYIYIDHDDKLEASMWQHANENLCKLERGLVQIRTGIWVDRNSDLAKHPELFEPKY